MDGVEPTWGHALYESFDQKVESKLIQPTFITMHPVDVSPLAKRSPKDGRLRERVEVFICASEMGNAFSELNHPSDRRGRHAAHRRHGHWHRQMRNAADGQ
jgi:lysyl-tRNA synthetase class 2